MKTALVLRSALFALLFSTGSSTIAQQEDTRFYGWYQVELLVFERIQTNTREQWPNNINLYYPLNIAQLKNSYGYETFDNSEFNDQQNTPEYADTVVNNANTQAFIKLEATEHTLTAEANKLRRNNNYHILFHEAWRQPIEDLASTPAVAIQGGENIDGHHQLEGSIQLSVNRYLHFETNLWRSTFEPNYGQEITYWPSLPNLPPPTNYAATNNSSDALDYSNIQLDSLRLDTTTQTDTNTFAIDTSDIQAPQFNEFAEIGKKAYLINQIITLKEKRRMRSAETHYIDHPSLSVLVHITPYTAPAENN